MIDDLQQKIAEFVFEVLKNRPPEMRLTSPRGDLRPSPIEEIPFGGTVWDDFGVQAFGLAYAVNGQSPKFIELGRSVPGNEKKSFQHVLKLEDLDVQTDALVSWFVWADDVGPDGQVRRTMGDLYFGEVRPFEEVFREGQGMEGQGGGGESGGEDRTGRLTDLQKQIVNATWKLQRDHSTMAERPPKTTGGKAPNRRDPERPDDQSRNSAPTFDHLFRREGFLNHLRPVAGQLAQADRSDASDEPDRDSAAAVFRKHGDRAAGIGGPIRIALPDGDLHVLPGLQFQAIRVRFAAFQVFGHGLAAFEQWV
jgi:hypothetical protein